MGRRHDDAAPVRTLIGQEPRRPLFIVLRREWFDAFRDGLKRHEWRRHDARWNKDTCRIGRPVILSLGYTPTRLRGVVVSFQVRKASGPSAAIYGEGTDCAVIGIKLDLVPRSD